MTRQPPTRKGLNAEKVAAALLLADGSPTRAARMLGVTRNTINYWVERGHIVIETSTTVSRHDAA